MLKIVNAFLKDHRKELGLKGYSKMSYLQKLKYLEEKTKVLKNIKPNTDLVKARTKIRGLLREEKNKKSIRSYAFKISIDRIEKIMDSPKLSQKQINAITMAKNTITNWRSFYNSKSMMGS